MSFETISEVWGDPKLRKSALQRVGVRTGLIAMALLFTGRQSLTPGQMLASLGILLVGYAPVNLWLVSRKLVLPQTFQRALFDIFVTWAALLSVAYVIWRLFAQPN